MTEQIDLYVGKRLRRRRRILGLTQTGLAEKVGIRFQQVHKYECGSNRVTASRLFEFSRALHVPVDYFFAGLEERERDKVGDDWIDPSVLEQEETIALIRAYSRIGSNSRKHLLNLARAMEGEILSIQKSFGFAREP